MDEQVSQALVTRPTGRVVESRSKAVGVTQIMGGENRWALVAEMNKLANRGEVRIIRRTPWWNHERGQWEVVVRRLKDPAPRWRKPLALTGAALAAIGALGWIGTMLAATTVGRLMFGAVAAIGLVAVGGWVSRLGERGRHAAVDVRVEVRVR